MKNDNFNQNARAANTRWAHQVDRDFAEQAAIGLLENWCARARLTVARPVRGDSPVDVVVLDDEARAIPVQVKAIATGGLTVWTKYARWPDLRLVYVVLDHAHGGQAARPRIHVLDPDTAIALPTKLGLRFDPNEHSTYRWSRDHRGLSELLAPHTAYEPEEMSRLLLEG